MFLIPRAKGANRRSGGKLGARLLILYGYLHPGNYDHSRPPTDLKNMAEVRSGSC